MALRLRAGCGNCHNPKNIFPPRGDLFPNLYGIATDGCREYQLREVIRNDAPGWISRTQVIV
jgi:hypothetical protein